MNLPHAGFPYSFSMINLVKLMPYWSWNDFDMVMAQTGTTSVELVPSMCLGVDWDHQIDELGEPVIQALNYLLDRYSVSSIQSIFYGLQFNFADHLANHNGLCRRLQALRFLCSKSNCSMLILGSPGHKKRPEACISDSVLKQRFTANCRWIASLLGPSLILSLEHNTNIQGAEYCNTLGDIMDVVRTLRSEGMVNVGINFDTKCLIHEFGDDVNVGLLLSRPELTDLITSIQVSYDFLTRDVSHRADDQRQLLSFARARSLTLSLEEFGLLENQFYPFVEAWTSYQ